MIKSEPILPIRFYDDLFDQQRFDKFCNECIDCQLKLVYPASEKPQFQFKRKSTLALPDLFYMRNTCTDKAYLNYKIVPESASHFGTTEATTFFGSFPKGGIYHNPDDPHEDIGGLALDISCGNLIPATPRPNCPYALVSSFISIPVSDNQLYKFKLIIDDLYIFPGSGFVIKIYTGGVGGNLIAAITEPGVYIFDINTGGDTDITLSFEGMTCNDNFSISYIQATMMLFNTTVTGDIILDPTKLKIFPMNNGTDIIVYCGDFATLLNVPIADYYYVVGWGDKYVVSEVFSIITLKEIQNHYKLTWWNVCDINKTDSVLYATNNNTISLNCEYKNTLYLDAGLFKPEYDTVEEGDENGAGDLTVNFQKWRKNLNFEVPKSPEFLTDALTAIFLHDNVYIKKPLNYYQEVLNNEYQVLKIINNVSQVLDDCFQKVNLKFLLENKYIDTACCTQAAVFDCTPCKYIAGDDCGEGLGYVLVISGVGVHGLFDCATGQLVIPAPRPTDLICYHGKYYTIELISGIWTVTNIFPQISNVTLVFFLFFADIYVIPNSFAQIEYNKNGTGWVLADTVQGDSNGYINYVIPFYIFLGPATTDLKLRVHNISLDCDFGYSDIYDVI